MFLASVVTGSSVNLASDRTLTHPPVRNNSPSGAVTRRYDSVKGNTAGTDVYMVYDNGAAIPNFLVTYRDR